MSEEVNISPFAVLKWNLTQLNFWDDCLICNSKEKIEMHHVKHISPPPPAKGGEGDCPPPLLRGGGGLERRREDIRIQPNHVQSKQETDPCMSRLSYEDTFRKV